MLYLGRKCVLTIGSKELKGQNQRQVEASALAAAAAYERELARRSDGAGVPQGPASVAAPPVQATTTRFPYEEAKQRFLNAVEIEIGTDRRATMESYFRLSVEPFFLEQQSCRDLERWPPLFDLFRNWLKNRARRDGRAGQITAKTANNHIDSVNRFLTFCKTTYDLKSVMPCKKFGRKVLGAETYVANGHRNGDQVWTEEEYLRFRQLAHKVVPAIAPVFDVAFGLGLRRGEAIALRVDRVHLDDDRMGLLGYVEVSHQYTRDNGQKQYVLRLPKWGRARRVPIPYAWLRDILRERISGTSPVRPGDNEKGLRYAAQRYSNVTIAMAVGVSETAVRKWMKRHGIERSNRIINKTPGEEAVQDIRSHLLFGRVNKQSGEYLFADEYGRLPSPDQVGKVFRELVRKPGLKAIRFHDLRHSFGTIWAERVPSSVLKTWMGHSSIATTEGYIHPNDDVSRRVLTDALAKNAAGDGGKTAS